METCIPRTRGIKRVLSDDEDSLPECLLQSVPVNDPYSSDDNLGHNNKRKTLQSDTQMRKKEKMILPPKACSTDFTGPEILFLFDLNYRKQKPPIDISAFPVVTILEEIFKFLYADDIIDDEDNYEFTRDGKTVPEIYSQYVKRHHWISWMQENDNLNFKTCQMDEWQSKRNNSMDEINQLEKTNRLRRDWHFLDKLLVRLYKNFIQNKCTRHDTLKYIFRYIESLLTGGENDVQQSRVSLRCNGDALFNLTYAVPADLVSKYCTEIADFSEIKIHPDSILATEDLRNTVETGRIVIELCGPQDESLDKADKEKKAKRKSNNVIIKPSRKTDAILTPGYENEAYDYLRESVPYDYHGNHTLNKLTAQHVLQLLGLAGEQYDLAASGLYTASDSYKPIGMFLEKEYILFSKLKISAHKVNLYKRPSRTVDDLPNIFPIGTDPEGVVSFSNWRLDLMLPNHRIAFLVAVLDFLNPEPLVEQTKT